MSRFRHLDSPARPIRGRTGSLIPAGLTCAVLLLGALVPASDVTYGQTAARRLTTIDAVRQFAGYYHLQNVLLRGEFADEGRHVTLRTDEDEIRVLLDENVRVLTGPVEVRGQLVDVGRLEPNDLRLRRYVETRSNESWPRSGEELFVRVHGVAPAEPATQPSVRALALEPWKFEGQQVTLVGNFRGRNLFGDLADSPRRSRHDFVLRSAEAAVWVSGLQPRGRGFELDVDRRVDTNRWLEVTGTVSRQRGLVVIEAAQLALATEPQLSEPADTVGAPPVPLRPLEVVFSSPVGGEVNVSPTAPVRIQFSRGLDESSLSDNIRATYVGGSAQPLAFSASYDAATRAIALRFDAPLERFRTVRIDILEGLRAFDGGPVDPWTLTFTVG